LHGILELRTIKKIIFLSFASTEVDTTKNCAYLNNNLKETMNVNVQPSAAAGNGPPDVLRNTVRMHFLRRNLRQRRPHTQHTSPRIAKSNAKTCIFLTAMTMSS
jgi:hypothetical protein